MSKERACIVCGMGSHRADWADKENPVCDNHSKDEVAAAIAAKAPPPAKPKDSKPAAKTAS